MTAPSTDTRKAALYLRQSFDKRKDNAAVDRQRPAGKALIGERGWTFVREFSDNDKSAKYAGTRPDFKAMLKAINAGEISAIVSWDMSRLVRNGHDRHALVTACQEQGVIIALVDGNDLDPTTAAGRIVISVQGEIAEEEIRKKGARQVAANGQRAERGAANASGSRPFGWRSVEREDGWTIEQVPAEAAAIAWAAESLLSGGSLRGVAREWAARGLKPTSGGDTWHATTVARVLQAPRHAAITVRDGKEYPGTWRKIIDRETWRAVCDKLTDPGRQNARGVSTLLGGIATCPCGAPVHGASTRTGEAGYRCKKSGKGHIGRGEREQIDSFITDLVIARLSMRDAADLLREDTSAEVEALRSRRRALAVRIDALGALLTDPDVPIATTKAAIAGVRGDLEGVDEELRGLTTPNVLQRFEGVGSVAAVWRSLDIDAQRAVVAALVNVELLAPPRGPRRGRGFDPALVRISWRV